jgi:hypothetical protein
VARRSTPRGRSRKRRSSSSRAAAAAPGTPVGAAAEPVARAGSAAGTASSAGGAARARGERGSAPAANGSPGRRSAVTAGERPPAPWHPLPLSELLIFAGAIAIVIGFSRGESGRAVLFAGLAAAAIGTIEVTWREHMSGYRSHAILLALLPTLVFHSAVILALASFMKVPRALNVGLLLPDAALFAFLYKLLRVRFLDARRERTFAARR